jgi:hypothetical protein
MRWVPPSSQLKAPAGSFKASLDDCEKDHEKKEKHLRKDSLVLRSNENQVRKPARSALVRVFSWLQEKYVNAPSKRLRVAEVVSFGEKRFVALVNVEGREFLIGGGASGVSLMKPLESVPEPADGLRSGSRVEEESD